MREELQNIPVLSPEQYEYEGPTNPKVLLILTNIQSKPKIKVFSETESQNTVFLLLKYDA